MSEQPDPAELVQRTAGEELLAHQGAALPESLGTPPEPAPTRARGKIVGLGAALTGVTLLAGIALVVLGVGELLSGASGLFIAVIAVGVVLIGTHWGWVHVAEFTANAIEGSRAREAETRRGQWLATIEPYSRYEVNTQVEADGSLTITTVRHRPVPVGPDHFSFTREVVASERHGDEQPAALIAERAEHLRREAALMTERERSRFMEAADVHRRRELGEQDEEERLRARRAASEALAQQINTNLRDPPLAE